MHIYFAICIFTKSSKEKAVNMQRHLYSILVYTETLISVSFSTFLQEIDKWDLGVMEVKVHSALSDTGVKLLYRNSKNLSEFLFFFHSV